jgi:hypothetical protein
MNGLTDGLQNRNHIVSIVFNGKHKILGNPGKLEEGISLYKRVPAELAAHTPWNQIASKYHVSTKTIASIRSKNGQPGTKSDSEGELAARVFELFDGGVRPSQVVRRLRFPPDLVSKLMRQYIRLSGHENPLCRECRKEGIAFGKSIPEVRYTCYWGLDDIVWNLADPNEKKRFIDALESGKIPQYRQGCYGDLLDADFDAYTS